MPTTTSYDPKTGMTSTQQTMWNGQVAPTPATAATANAQQAAASTFGTPVTAPAAPAKTTVSTTPPVTPVAVASSNLAKNVVSQAKEVATQGSSAIAAANEAARQRSIALVNGTITDQSSMDAFKQKQQSVTQPSAVDQAASDIAGTPENGYKWAYQKDGTKVQIPLSSTAESYGMSDQKPFIAPNTSPTGATPVETVEQDDGGTVVKFGDGTYGGFSPDGTYRGSLNAQTYENAKVSSNTYQRDVATKNALDIQSKIDQIINGTYPLSADQQAQINAVKQQFQNLIDQQVLANKNYEGGVAIAQGMTGMSEYSPTIAMGNLKGAIDSGVTKVAELNNKMISAITQINQAFRSDNMKMLQQAYENYTTYADKKQAELDKISEAAAKHETDIRNYNLEVEKLQEKSYYDDLSAKLAKDSLSLNEKKDLMADKLNWARLSEDKRHNIATEYETQQKRLQDAVGNTFDVSNVPFANTVIGLKNGLLSRGQTPDKAKTIASAIAERLSVKDFKTAKQYMEDQVPVFLTAANQTKYMNAKSDLSLLDSLQSKIEEYQANNGDMGLLKGTASDISKKLGQRYGNGQMQTLAGELDRVFQEYRQNMTGAAFGVAENRDYGSINPRVTDNFDLALDKIKGATNFNKNYVDSVNRSVLHDSYNELNGVIEAEDKINNYLANAPVQTQQTIATMAQENVPYNEIITFINSHGGNIK